VERNRRERLFGAMVASVATRGYAATRLTGLVELSGVSSRSLYDSFPDVESCFRATLEELFGMAAARLDEASATKGGETWEERARRGAVAFAELVAEQPAAARLCLLEAHAAGPETLQLLRQATADFEARAQRAALARPGSGEMPAEMVSAYVGALQAVARERLRAGTEGELPRLVDDLVANLLSRFEPPPAALRLSSRWTPPPAEALPAFEPGERILRALMAVAAEKGYAAATVDEVVSRAQISASTFYAHFGGKEEAALAALDSAGAQIVAAVLPAFRRTAEWPRAVRAALGALLNLLASRPALARFVMVEAHAMGPVGVERRREALRPLDFLWAEARSSTPGLPPVLFEAIPGAIFHLVNKRILEEGVESLPSLAPLCAYIGLVPFVGPDRAVAAANEEGEVRRPDRLDPVEVRQAYQRASKVFPILCERRATVRELAELLEQPIEAVRPQVTALERSGLVRAVGDGDEQAYEAILLERDTEDWSRLSPAEQELASAQLRVLVETDLDRSMKAGLFDARPERVWVRMGARVDDRGWNEISRLHVETMARVRDIAAQSTARLAESGEPGIETRNVFAAFEVPRVVEESGEEEGPQGPSA
jgi:AcrR family transcriptional regulator